VRKLKFRQTTYILTGCITLLIGLFISKFTYPAATGWLLLVIILLPLVFGNQLIRMIYVIIAMFIIGWWRGGLQQAQFQELAGQYDKKVTIVGRALEDGTYSKFGQLETTLDVLSINNQPASGKITLRTFNLPAIYRYDVLEATGKLYPTRGGKQGAMYYSDTKVIAKSESKIEDFRRGFIVGMENAVPEPAASFGIGLLVGQRDLLPQDVSQALQLAGLTHIVAVSGYNLTIIVNAVRRGSKRLSRFQTLFITATLIYLFLLVTGFMPSIVRASVVAGLGMLAWYFGREFRASLLILFTAAITAMVNPYYVWGDIGWYLSFLAFFGVLMLAPILVKVFSGSNKELPLLPTVAIESFSAQVMTLPLIMFIFGRISLVGFFANIIIVPLVPIAMLFSLVAGLAGMIFNTIAGWVGLPARLLLNSMLNIAEWFASWPKATALITISAASMLGLYLIIYIFLIALNKRAQSVIIEES
jgi:competence protein ComEC